VQDLFLKLVEFSVLSLKWATRLILTLSMVAIFSVLLINLTDGFELHRVIRTSQLAVMLKQKGEGTGQLLEMCGHWSYKWLHIKSQNGASHFEWPQF